MKECPIIIFLTYLFQLIVSMQSTQLIKYSTFENFGIFRYSTIENFGIFCTFPLIFGILLLHLCNERSVIKLLYYRDMSNEIQFLLYNLPEDDGKV